MLLGLSETLGQELAALHVTMGVMAVVGRKAVYFAFFNFFDGAGEMVVRQINAML